MDTRTGALRTLATSLTATAALALVSMPAHAAADHLVQPGDTVTGLAARYGVSTASIVEANRLGPRATIYAGTHLTIPTSTPQPVSATYVVKAGDTAWGLARTYGVSLTALRQANLLDAAFTLRIGQNLTIPGASPSASLATPVSASVASTASYTVRSGDTLSSVARRLGTSVSALAATNRLANPSLIRVGQVLTVPGGAGAVPTLATDANVSSMATTTSSYVVRFGDTVSSIAARYGTSISALASANHLANPGLIQIGQMLTVPGGSPTGLVGSTFLGRTYAADVVAAANVNKATLNAMDVPTRSQMQQMVIETAKSMGVDPALAQAIAYQDSGFNMRAVSPANAVGCMQVIPSSGAWAAGLVGRDLNLLVPSDNVTAGVAILRQLLRNGTPLDTAIAGYYQGERSVRERGMNSDTVRYVASVKSLTNRFD